MVLSRLGIFYVHTNGVLALHDSIFVRFVKRLPLWFPITILDARVGNDYVTCVEIRWGIRR